MRPLLALAALAFLAGCVPTDPPAAVVPPTAVSPPVPPQQPPPSLGGPKWLGGVRAVWLEESPAAGNRKLEGGGNRWGFTGCVNYLWAGPDAAGALAVTSSDASGVNPFALPCVFLGDRGLGWSEWQVPPGGLYGGFRVLVEQGPPS